MIRTQRARAVLQYPWKMIVIERMPQVAGVAT